MVKTSTEISSTSHIVGEEKAVELIAKAGFDCWDFSMFNMGRYDWTTKQMIHTDHPLQTNGYLAFARKLKRIGLDNGITCNQSHAPFPVECKEIRDLQKRAIECTAEAGGSICVIHPDNNLTVEENAEFYLSLLPFAKEHGITIATENMWNWDAKENHATPAACSDEEYSLKLLNAVGSENFGYCLDIGHAEMKGLNTSAVKMLRALKDKVVALHIHDNDKVGDLHRIPFSESINFEEIMHVLREIDYKGILTLESDTYVLNFKDNPFQGVCDLYSAVKKLADMFNGVNKE